MTTRRIMTLALAAMLANAAATTTARVRLLLADKAARTLPAVAADTISDDEEEGDTAVKSRRNVAKGFNALKYIMEGRYRQYGDQFTRHWSDHVFFELGAGLQQIVPPGKGYELMPMTRLHFGAGKQFNRLHTARLSLDMSTGYLRKINYRFSRFGLAADWIFSVSSYFGGFKPSRLLDVSTVLGAGAQYTNKENAEKNSLAGELHAGLQLRFFAGPQAYVALEPYAGVATDNIDQSGNRNWRRRDIFYGANLNFVYYLHNNLSPQERQRFVNRHLRQETDSLMPEQWRAPWFFEFAAGPRTVSSATLSSGQTLGHGMTISAGKWLSPAFGVRAGLSVTTTTWLKEVTPATKKHPEYTNNQHNMDADLRIEALINPLGFLSSFRWDAPVGAYLTAGGGVGWLQKNQQELLRCRSTFMTAGMHLWAKVGQDLHVFVEPQYTRYSYRIPYVNVDWSQRFNDNAWALNIGLQVNTRSKDYRQFVSGKAEYLASLPHFVVGMGLGGGVNLTHTKSAYGSQGFGYNAMSSIEYHMNDMSAVRLAFEYLSISANSLEKYDYLDLNHPDYDYLREERTGLFNRRYGLGMISLGYLTNLSNIMSGFNVRRMELEAFAGPALMMLINHSSALDASETLEANHSAETREEKLTKQKFGLNAGLKLKYNLTRQLALTFTPQVYLMWGESNLPGLNFTKTQLMETFSLGMQYSL